MHNNRNRTTQPQSSSESEVMDMAQPQIVNFQNAATLLQSSADQPLVSVSGYFYAVDFGPDVRPQHHRVDKHKRCACYLGADCPAVAAVASYLRDGGERTPDPPLGYFPVAPAECPICGEKASYDASLSSPKRGAGWRCAIGGSAHYWEYHVIHVLARQLRESPWLFPPVYDARGQLIYPGMRRDDLVSGDYQPIWPDGYTPYA